MSRGPRSSLSALAAVAVGANIAVIFVPDPVVRTLAGLLIACFLPGWMVAALVLRRGGGDALERAVMAVGVGCVLLVVGGMAVHYLPGPITAAGVLFAADALLGFLLALAWRRGIDASAPRVPRRVALHLAVLLVVAIALRIPDLGYAEFQGDEATILLKAAAAVEGRTDALFVHKKGPAEILITALSYGLAGTATETSTRLPFALAMIAGLLALYQVTRVLFGERIALVAALLVAVNGFFVGFGRIVQYQSVVFLMSALAVLAAVRFRQDRLARTHLALSVLFVAVGVLAHYDAILVVPAVAALAVWRWRERRDAIAGDVACGAASTVVAAAVLSAFYVPMALHPYFREATLPYIFDVRIGGEGGPFYNALENSVLLATFYNATYYMAFLAAALLAGLAAHLARTGPRRAGRLLAAAFVVGAVLVVATPDAWQVGGTNLTIVFLVVAVGVLLASRSPSEAWKIALIWFASGFIVYAALVGSPRTHFHVAFPPWSILVAATLDAAYRRLPSTAWRRAAALAFAGLYAVFAWYAYLVFVQHDVEYRRAFPAVKPPGYWMPTVELPTNGWFGFPYRAGWKAIGAMYADGRLQGTYWSNEEENVTDWYTRGAPRCDVEPRYYFVAEDVQDVRPIPADLEAEGYALTHRVSVGGRPRIRVYERGAGARAVSEIEVSNEEGRFDRLADARFEPNLPYAYDRGYMAHRLVADLGAARLLGYDIDTDAVRPGGEIVITTYWSGTAPMDKDYSVFAHLAAVDDTAAVISQSDGAPGICGKAVPTTTWPPGRIVVDRRAVRVPANAAPGVYVLLLGLYDYETLERLPVRMPDGAEGDHVRLGAIAVEAGPS